MEWIDEGIVLGVRRHGESSAIVELLTRAHGRHLGLVRGGAGSKMRPVLQPGNGVRAVWRARLDEHLGTYAIEGTRLRAASLLESSHAVAWAIKNKKSFKKKDVVIVNLSGRGDKDVETVAKQMGVTI